jgi:hypothetical protein
MCFSERAELIAVAHPERYESLPAIAVAAQAPPQPKGKKKYTIIFLYFGFCISFDAFLVLSENRDIQRF